MDPWTPQNDQFEIHCIHPKAGNEGAFVLLLLLPCPARHTSFSTLRLPQLIARVPG